MTETRPPLPASPPSWDELIDRVSTAHDDEPMVSGVVRATATDPQILSAGWYSEGAVPPLIVSLSAGPLHAWRQGHRLRLEQSPGALLALLDRDSSWTFESGRQRPLVSRTDRVHFGPGALIASRPGADVWSGQGPFHHGARWPVTPIGATDRFGRSAWSVSVRSAGGSAPEDLVVDAETGTVLSWRAPDAGWSAQWDDFMVGAPVPAGWFTWAGPTVSVADLEAGEQQEKEATAVARNEWFRSHIGPIPLELLLAHKVRVESLDEDTGEFTADVGFGGLHQLARRRRSAQPWVHPTPGHWIGWSDADWDWAVQVEGSLPAEGLRLLQQQLHSTPV